MSNFLHYPFLNYVDNRNKCITAANAKNEFSDSKGLKMSNFRRNSVLEVCSKNDYLSIIHRLQEVIKRERERERENAPKIFRKFYNICNFLLL